MAVDVGENREDDLDSSERSSQTIAAQGTPSRKPQEHPHLLLLASVFTEKLKSRTESLPTPNSREYRVASSNIVSERRLSQLLDVSPTPGQFKDVACLDLDAESGLTTTVLNLIRSNNL